MKAVLAQPRLATGCEGNQRSYEMWNDNGLRVRLTQALDSELEANRVADLISTRAALRDPAGVLGCALSNYAGFFSIGWMDRQMKAETGVRPLSAEYVRRLREYHADGTSINIRPTLMRELYPKTLPWVILLLQTPLVLLAVTAVADPLSRVVLALPLLLATIMVVTVLTLAVTSIPRYLHPVSPMLILGLCAAAPLLAARRTCKLSGTSR